MIFAFKKSAVWFIVPTAIFAAVCVFYILDVFLFDLKYQTIGTVVLAVSVLLLAVCMRISLRVRKQMYNQSVKLCDTDADAFLDEQNRILHKASKPNKAVVMLNMAHGLIAHERYDEAEKILHEAEELPFVKKSIHQQFLVLSRLITVSLRGKKYADARSYVQKQQKMAEDLAEKSQAIAVNYQKAAEHNLLVCNVMEGIYSGTDVREIAGQMYLYTEQSLKKLNPDTWFYSYSFVNSHYTMGLLSYAIGDKEKSDRHFRQAAEIEAKYPLCKRIRQYLDDGNINALVGMDDNGQPV